MNSSSSYLVFGATGAIGSSCVRKLKQNNKLVFEIKNLPELENQLHKFSKVDGVIWAHGINLVDGIDTFDCSEFENVMDVNVNFILKSMKILRDSDKLTSDAQLVVLSSIWGYTGRPKKLSYAISKSALGGLVRSLAVDLGPFGFQINSVSPGPIDTPMTKKNLTFEELTRIISETPIKRLVSLEEVTSVIYGLVSGQFRGITGQDIVIDGGWSVCKLV